MRDYAAMTTLIVTELQSAGTIDYTVAEVDYQIKETLKYVGGLSPHIVPITFALESRTGSDVTGAAGLLTDTVKGQFLTTDVTNEKVVHNISNNRWSVVQAYTSGSVLTLSVDIMYNRAGDRYEIFNKRCFNKRQIWIGDILPEVLVVESVEYPIGTRRNWKIVSEGILEIDCDYIPDSNFNVTSRPDVTVLVRFARPHILSQMTDWLGVVSGTTNIVASTSLVVGSLASSATVYEGDELSIANFRQSYIVSAGTTANSAGVATFGIYPPLETGAGSATVVAFTKSTLKPYEETAFAKLVAGRILQHKSPKFINTVAKGGSSAFSNYYDLGTQMVNDALTQLGRDNPPKTKKRYSPD